ncbi:MAG: PEGA domain-containing protein [Polyangiales bacterium]
MEKKIERATGRPPTARLGAAVALGLAAALAAAPARSQPADRRREREARALFERGVQRADRRRWAEALEAFERSLALLPRPSTRFNIAQALLRMGRFRAAASAFEAHQAAQPPDDDGARVARSRAMLAEARARLVPVALSGVPEGAEVLVDGAPEPAGGTTRSLPLDPGLHRFEVRTADGRSERFELTLVAGTPAARALTLAPAAAPTEAATPPPFTHVAAVDAFRRGAETLRAGRLDEAVVALQEAVRLEPTPGTWRWLGVTLRGLGRYLESVEAFERYLAAPEPDATVARLEEVQLAVGEMRRSLARLTVTVRPATASLLVDGRVRAPGSEPLLVNPGPHAVELRAEGYETNRREVELTPGGQLVVTADLAPQAGRLVVEPSVPGAVITVDGAEAGRGRVERAVAAGEHAVEIRAEGHEPLQRRVTVTRGGVVRVDAVLVGRRLPGWVVPVAVAGGLLVAGGVTAAVVLATRGTEPPLPTSWGNFAEALTLP